MYGTTSPKQEKQQSKGNFINIINLPNQHQSTQSTSYARHQSTKDCPVAILAPSISSSAQLNLQRCLQDLMAIFQSTTSLLRGLEYGLYWFMNQFLFWEIYYLSEKMSFSILNIIRWKYFLSRATRTCRTTIMLGILQQEQSPTPSTGTSTAGRYVFFSHPELITPELKRTQALTMTLTESAHEVCHHVWIDSELSPPRMD